MTGLRLHLLLAAFALANGPFNLSEQVADGRLGIASKALAAIPWHSQPATARLDACRLLLFENALDRAIRCLKTPIAGGMPDHSVSPLLAEALARKGEWSRAADAYAADGQQSLAARARAFAIQQPFPNLLQQVVTISFERRDPLPVIKIRTQGGAQLYFLLDTGAGDTVIDPKIADQLGVQRFGSVNWTFAGGKTASVESGILDRLDVGRESLHRLPVILLDTSRFRAAAGGLPISGIIGVGLLSRFLSTIDYPRGRLVLQPRSFERVPSPNAVSVPFWLAGDHLVLAEGALNGVDELALIDTGLAGGGCAAPRSTLEATNLEPSGPVGEGIGGGGAIGAQIFQARSIELGKAMMTNVTCIAGAFPPTIEHSTGTRIGLLISHGALRSFAVTLDFRRMRLTLDPGERAVAGAARP